MDLTEVCENSTQKPLVATVRLAVLAMATAVKPMALPLSELTILEKQP